MSWTIKQFNTNADLVSSLATNIATDLHQAINTKGHASMAVSGGRLPKTLFQRLADTELPWHKVTITLVDERWVDPGHPDANAKLVHDYLLQNNAAAASFIPLKTAASEAFGAEAEVQARLIAEVPMPFDVAILGMGADGHTASFFPGASTPRQALNPEPGQLCRAVRPLDAPHDRMTLTLPVLLAAKHLVLHIVGKDKWRVLQNAMRPGPTEDLPVRAVLHQSRVLLDIHYAAD